MEEVDRLIAESEAILQNGEARRAVDISDVMDSTNRTLNSLSDISAIVLSDGENSPRASASEAIVAAAQAVANTASNLFNDSELEILDCTTFPMPLPVSNSSDDDDEVFFISETAPRRRRDTFAHLHNVNINLGRNPSNINLNIDFNRVLPDPRELRNRRVTHTSSTARKRKPHVATPMPPSPKVPASKSSEPEEEVSGNGFSCAVCLDNLKGSNKPVSTNCGHLFCLSCLTSAIKATGKCPLCNKKQGKNTFHRIYI